MAGYDVLFTDQDWTSIYSVIHLMKNESADPVTPHYSPTERTAATVIRQSRAVRI